MKVTLEFSIRDSKIQELIEDKISGTIKGIDISKEVNDAISNAIVQMSDDGEFYEQIADSLIKQIIN